MCRCLNKFSQQKKLGVKAREEAGGEYIVDFGTTRV